MSSNNSNKINSKSDVMDMMIHRGEMINEEAAMRIEVKRPSRGI
jgi:hypothetical protein